MKRFIKFIVRAILLVFVLANIVLAFHAYKLTHFYNTGEIEIKSEKEKTSWEHTKDMLFGLNATKVPNDFIPDSTIQKVYFKTIDSLKLSAWYFKADGISKGTVLLFHGHHANKSGVITESDNFRKLGYNTLLLDFRAHGESEGNATTIGFYEGEDVKLAYDFVKNKGEKNIILWGISMGAAAITKSINDYNIQPSKIILEMPYGSLLNAVEGKLNTMHLPQEPLASLLTFWGGTEHGFWAFNMKPTEFAKKIKCPVLLQWGKNDQRVTKKEIDEIYNNIATTKKLVVYDSSGHESLCGKENGKWVGEVKEFLQ